MVPNEGLLSYQFLSTWPQTLFGHIILPNHYSYETSGHSRSDQLYQFDL